MTGSMRSRKLICRKVVYLLHVPEPTNTTNKTLAVCHQYNITDSSSYLMSFSLQGLLPHDAMLKRITSILSVRLSHSVYVKEAIKKMLLAVAAPQGEAGRAGAPSPCWKLAPHLLAPQPPNPRAATGYSSYSNITLHPFVASNINTREAKADLSITLRSRLTSSQAYTFPNTTFPRSLDELT